MKSRLIAVLLVLAMMLALVPGVAGAQPTEVWVDDDFGSDTPGWNATHFASVQAGINAVAVAGTVHVAEGAYQENLADHKDMEITKSLSLIGAGPGRTVLELRTVGDTLTHMNGVEIRGSDLSVTIQGITLTKRPGATYASNYPLRIAETSSSFINLTLCDVEVAYAKDMGVHMGGAGTFGEVLIENCNFHHNRYAIYQAGTVTNMVLKNSVFENNTYMTVCLSGSYGSLAVQGVNIFDSGHYSFSLSGNADNVLISGCDFQRGGTYLLYMGHDKSTRTITGEMRVENSKFIAPLGATGIAVNVERYSIGKLVFDDVEIAYSGGPNIRVVNNTTIGELRFVGCNIHNATGIWDQINRPHGVYLMGKADKVVITESHFYNNIGRGFDFAPLGTAAVRDVTVIDSTFSNNARDGIGISETVNATFARITASNNGGAGVCVWEWRVRSAGLNFIDSTFEDNGWNGLVFVAAGTGKTVEDASISGCIITGNAGWGVEFWRQGLGTISGVAVDKCTVASNGGGIGATNMLSTVDATLNYWGHKSGPAGEGTGFGDPVSTNVSFAPWYLDSGFSIASNALTLTAPVVGSGTVAPSLAGPLYTYGDEVVLTATPASHWEFDKWAVGGVESADPSVAVTMDGHKTATAHFSRITHALTLAVEGQGTIDPGAGVHTYNEPDAVTLTATPAPGWQFCTWGGPVADVAGSSTTVTMDASKTVRAVFTMIEAPPFVPGPPPPPPPPPPVLPPALTAVSLPVSPDAETVVSVSNLTVTLPAGGISTTGTMVAAPLAPDEEPPPGAGLFKVGDSMYYIVAEDDEGNSITEFAVPLVLSWTYDPAGLPERTTEDDLQVFYWDETLEAWVAIPSEKVNGTITATVDHLTVFALMAAPDLVVPADIAGHWAEADILKLVSLGVVKAQEDPLYRPNDSLTRAEAVRYLVRALDLPASTTGLAFTDEIPAWADPYVRAAVKAGVIFGYEDGTFRPDNFVTRAELVVMILRARPQELTTTVTFADAASIQAWAREAVQVAVAVGLVKGYPDNTFRPDNFVTRGEAAAIFFRAMHMP